MFRVGELARVLRTEWTLALSITVVTALGTGVNTGIYTVARSVILQPLPYPDEGKLVMMWKVRRDGLPPVRGLVTAAHYAEWTAAQSVFSSTALVQSWVNDPSASVDTLGVTGPRRLRGSFVSPTFFPTLGVTMALGRVFDEDAEDGDVVVISHALWQRDFGGSLSVLQATIPLASGRVGRSFRPVRVIGVLPAEFRFTYPEETEIWLPLTSSLLSKATPLALSYGVVARLRRDVDIAQANAAVSQMADQLAITRPELHRTSTIRLEPMREYALGTARRLAPLLSYLLFVVNLLMVTSVGLIVAALVTQRRGALATRYSLGASENRLVGHVMAWLSIPIATGIVGGAFVGKSLVDVLRTIIPSSLPRSDELSLDASTLLVSSATVVAVGLPTVLVGGRRLIRTAAAFVHRQGPGAGSSTVERRTRRVLLSAQSAIAIPIVALAFALNASLSALEKTDVGFEGTHRFVAEIRLMSDRYVTKEGVARFKDAIQNVLARLAIVEKSALASTVPLLGPDLRVSLPRMGSDPVQISIRHVTPSYFDTMGIRLLRGRAFATEEDATGQRVAVISQSLGVMLFGSRDPIGELLDMPRDIRGSSARTTVVGIVGDVRQLAIDMPMSPTLYLPSAHSEGNSVFIVLRSSHKLIDLAGSLKSSLATVDSQQPVVGPFDLEQIISRQTADRRFALRLASSLALLALLIAAVSIYGVVRRDAVDFAPEMAIRRCLGARDRDVVRRLVWHVMRPIAIGLCGGVILTLGLFRVANAIWVLESPGVTTMAATVATVTAVAIAACVPAAMSSVRSAPVSGLFSVR